MNNKGFTLVELIATIALLAIISVISFVSINAVVDKSKISECEALVTNIKSAASGYVSDNRYKVKNAGDGEKMDGHLILDDSGEKYIVFNAKVLIDNKRIVSNVKDDTGKILIANPFGKPDIDPADIDIKVTLNSDYTAKVIDVKNKDNNIINCENKKW